MPMERHTCKLCFRNFPSGRALGGHMRSHVMAGTAAPAGRHRVLLPDSSASNSTFSREAAEEEEEEAEQGGGKGLGQSYVLRENPKRSFRMVDPEFSSFAAVDASSSVVQDRESETESPRGLFLRCRSKRPRTAIPTPPEVAGPGPGSSVSDTTAEEDVAISLVMLSRDAWASSFNRTKSAEAEQQQSAGSDNHDEDMDDEEGDRIALGSQRSIQQLQRRSKYQCETCKKSFRSYQALGGHRASHKKLKGCIAAVQFQIPGSGVAKGNADLRGAGSSKVHECPICSRVFPSGQALGGHKRSHLSSATTITITSSPATPPPPSTSPAITDKYVKSLIDLNLPASMEEEAAERSAVSDAEFLGDHHRSY